jgi:cell division septation protein DedD
MHHFSPRSGAAPGIYLAICLALAIRSESAAAQRTAADSVFVRAEQAVREGAGSAGRALVDSVLGATPPDSPVYAEALYWRATFAVSAEDAEPHFRRIVVEHPAHARAEDATWRLAQLELARGDRERALAHLQRFEREYPSSAHRARASLMLARLYLDQRELPSGCSALGSARAAVGAGETELRNQIEYYVPRCEGVDTTAAARSGERIAAGEASTDSVRTATNRSRTSASSGADSSSGGAPRRTTARAPTGRYTVQLAAFNTRREAQSLVDALRDRGIEARIAGDKRPFRVRTGRYATRAEANRALATIKAKKLNGFVTEAEPAPR